MKVNKENEEVLPIEVRCYAIDANPFDSVYNIETVVDKMFAKREKERHSSLQLRYLFMNSK